MKLASHIGCPSRRSFLKATALGGACLAIGPWRRAFAAEKAIGMNLPFRAADVYKPLLKGAQQVASEHGYTLLQAGAELAAAPQLAELNAWIARDIAAMTVFPVDVNSLAPVIARAHAKNIPVIAYGVEIPGSDGATLFHDEQGTDLQAQTTAKWVNEKGGGHARIVLLGHPEIADYRSRLRATVTKMQKLTKVDVIAEARAITAPTGLTTMQSVLQAHPDVNVVLCQNDGILTGAARAIQSAGKVESIWVGSFDGSKAAMQMLFDRKVMGATMAFDLVDLGRSIILAPLKVLNKEGPVKILNDYVAVTNDTPDIARKLIAQYD